MATYFNLPFRAEHAITFITDARGYRNAMDLAHAEVAVGVVAAVEFEA